MISDVSSLKLIKLPHHFEDNGDLIIMEKSINIPFNVNRVFVVRAPQGAIRGEHAHKACSYTNPNKLRVVKLLNIA